jgi:hypothetical protein
MKNKLIHYTLTRFVSLLRTELDFINSELPSDFFKTEKQKIFPLGKEIDVKVCFLTSDLKELINELDYFSSLFNKEEKGVKNDNIN